MKRVVGRGGGGAEMKEGKCSEWYGSRESREKGYSSGEKGGGEDMRAGEKETV
jgi:hypothetical protein